MADIECKGDGKKREEIRIIGDDKQSEGQLMTDIQKEARKEDNHTLTSEDNQDLNTANDVVKRELHRLKVSESEASKLSSQLEKEKWHESYEVMKAYEIQKEKIDEYLDHLKGAYEGLEDMIAENRSNIKSESHSILENKFMTDDGSGVRYCILAFGKSPDGMLINCMYVLYKMDFVLGKAKEKKSMFGDLKRWITTKFELVKTSGLERCESFRNFFRIKALRGLQKEGLIDEINFVDS